MRYSISKQFGTAYRKQKSDVHSGEITVYEEDDKTQLDIFVVDVPHVPTDDPFLNANTVPYIQPNYLQLELDEEDTLEDTFLGVGHEFITA